MRPVIAGKVKRLAPSFDQAVDADRGNGLAAALREEKRLFRRGIWSDDQIVLYRVCAIAVYDHLPRLARLPLPEVEGLAGLDVADLPHGDPGEVAGAQVGVDAHHEQSQVAWLARQELFDGADMFDVTDGVNGDNSAFWGVIRVGHNSPYFTNLYKYYHIKLVSCQDVASRDGRRIVSNLFISQHLTGFAAR